MAHESGSIVLIDYPFSDLVQAKRRPGVVLLDAGDGDMLIARITGRAPRDSRDYAIGEWQSAGLLRPSTVRLAKLVTFRTDLILRDLGRISDSDRAGLLAALNALFSRSLAPAP